MMKNICQLVRTYFHVSINLNKKIHTGSTRSLRCVYDFQSGRRHCSTGSKITNGGKNYFIELSDVLHEGSGVKAPSVNTTSSLKIAETPVKKFNLQPNLVERHALEAYEGDTDDERFDSLAEKELKFEDVPKVTQRSFNLAAYASKSETLQQLVKLGVDLSKWDKMKDVPEFIIKLDFDKHISQHIKFLHDVGVSADSLGTFLTKNPVILKQRLDDLQVRINYLESKRFSSEAIARIMSKAPHFLLFSTQAIDKRLGYLQTEYKLSGDEVRSVITRQPKLAIWNFIKIRDKYFVLKEELGFSPQEVKTLLLNKPKLWLLEQRSLIERFNYVHLTMKIPHDLIVKFPECLTRRRFQMKQRHLFLVALNRAQYDPTKECYVSLHDLSNGIDIEFCSKVAKTTVQKFNEFLKTL